MDAYEIFFLFVKKGFPDWLHFTYENEIWKKLMKIQCLSRNVLEIRTENNKKNIQAEIKKVDEILIPKWYTYIYWYYGGCLDIYTLYLFVERINTDFA